jgi:hypothetical protein
MISGDFCKLRILTIQDCIELYEAGIAVIYSGGRSVSFEIIRDYKNSKCPGHIADGTEH